MRTAGGGAYSSPPFSFAAPPAFVGRLTWELKSERISGDKRTDNKRIDVRVYDEQSLKTVSPEYAGKTVALYKTIPNTQIKVLAQRRVYDENGVVLQDFDYWHGAGAHIFPHIHIWLEPSFDMRSGQIAYR